MSQKFKLSKRKRKWVKQFKPTATLRGSALNYPVTIEKKYERSVQNIIQNLINNTEKEVLSILTTPAAKKFYAEDSNLTHEVNRSMDRMIKSVSDETKKRLILSSRHMVEAANLSSQFSMNTSLKDLSGGEILKTSKFGGKIPEILVASIKTNVDSTESVSSDYLLKISAAVYFLIMFGKGIEYLTPVFKKQEGITKRKVKNITHGQTRRVYNAFNNARMENVGLSEFEWLHSGADRVPNPRPFHISRFPKGLNGGIYDRNDPPLIEKKTGIHGLPGDLINCKCMMIPVVTFKNGNKK